MPAPIPALPSLGLADMQGNILKGHGRKYSALVLFRFWGTPAENRSLLRAAADPANPHHATSAAEQAGRAALHRAQLARWKFFTARGDTARAAGAHVSQDPFRSLGLTAAGLQACQCDDLESGTRGDPAWTPFWDGMSPENMWDPKPWKDGYDPVPHGVWLLAHADEGTCRRMVEECVQWLHGFHADKVAVEHGFRWEPNCDGIGHEPFGFADGFARTRIVVRPDTLLEKIARWFAPLLVRRYVRPFEIPVDQVVLSDPPAVAGGSFLVLRTLEQNVQEFLKAERELEKQRDRLPEGAKILDAGALFIGRERDGTPLVRRSRPLQNRFHFGGDPEGGRCPFHAHIRKMNPRQISGLDHAQAGRARQKLAQFVRRGMVWGDPEKLNLRWPSPEVAPPGGVGLLFMGYMTSIGGQFLQMQKSWAPDEFFPRGPGQPGEGVDPLFATNPDNPPPSDWQWRKSSGMSLPPLARFVTGCGGAYFLVPPLTWLANCPP